MESRKKRMEHNKTHRTTVVVCGLGGYDFDSNRKRSKKGSRQRLKKIRNPKTRYKKQPKTSRSIGEKKEWAGFARHPVIQQALLKASKFMTAAWTEAFLLADVHIKRCLQEEPEALKLGFGRPFWDPIFATIRRIAQKKEFIRPEIRKQHTEMERVLSPSASLYNETRNTEYEIPEYQSWMKPLVEEACKLAVTSFRNKWSAKNYTAYFRRYLALLLKERRPAFAAGTRFGSALNAFTEIVMERGHDRAGEIVAKFTSLTKTITDEDTAWMAAESKRLEAIGHPKLPFKKAKKDGEEGSDGDDGVLGGMVFLWNNVLPVLAEKANSMAQEIAAKAEEEGDSCGCETNHKKNKRGGRGGRRGKLAFAMSVVPSFHPKFVRLTNTGLIYLLEALARSPDEKEYLKYADPLTGTPYNHEKFKKFKGIVEKKHHEIDHEDMWNTCFDIKKVMSKQQQCGSGSSKFFNFESTSITTDGVSVYVTLKHTKTEEELRREERDKRMKIVNTERKKAKKEASAARREVPKFQKTEDELERDAEAKASKVEKLMRARKTLSTATSPPSVFDPGQNSTYTGGPYTQEAIDNAHLYHEMERLVIVCDKQKRARLAGHDKKNAVWKAEIAKRPRIKEVFVGMPTAKGPTLQSSLLRSKHIHKHKKLIDEFYSDRNCFRRLRFGCRIRDQQANEFHVREMTGVKKHERQKKKIVVMGDASINGGCGGAPMVNKRLKELLDRRCLFFEQDEFRTSKCCPCCYGFMEGELITHPCGFQERSWERRQCDTTDCRVRIIHRDHAAFLNIGAKFMCYIDSDSYPKNLPIPLQRGGKKAIPAPPPADVVDAWEEGFSTDADEMIPAND